MPSRFVDELRKVPSQERGEKRVTGLLDAAASVLAETGYEAATMSAIAGRAGASIGSLYQFFPNKVSLAQALRLRYFAQFQDVWSPLEAEAAHLTVEALVNIMIDSMLEYVNRHPALTALMDAPASTQIPAAISDTVVQRVARIFIANRPGLPKPRALQLAFVTLRITKALCELQRDATPRQKKLAIQEFKVILICYLNLRMEPSK